MVLRLAARKAARPRKETPPWVRHFLPKGAKVARSHLINPRLCDDVLDRLEPTLPSPYTCDLIDVNPGTGLWSEKLHKLIKPRRHILVEPLMDRYEDYIKWLLRSDPASYRLAPTLEDVFQTERDYFSPELGSTAPKDRFEVNPSLLMTINLTGVQQHLGTFTTSPSVNFMYNLFHSNVNKFGHMYRYGSFRMLMWLPEGEKHMFAPRSVAQRSKMSVQLELMSNSREIASSTGYNLSRTMRRWYELDMENIAAVSEKERAVNIFIPESRHQIPPSPPLMSIANPHPDTLRGAQYISDAMFVDEFLALDEKLKETDPAWYSNLRPSPTAATATVAKKTPDHRRWEKLFASSRNAHVAFMRCTEAIRQKRRIDGQWRDLFRNGDQVDPEALKRLQQETARVDAVLLDQTNDNFRLANRAVDDYRAYDLDPSPMSWNQRQEEPLLVFPEEFSSHPLFLLDAVPKPEFYQQVDTVLKLQCLNHILRWFLRTSAKSVAELLGDLLQDGSDEFISRLPNLRNPNKGGSYDLSDLRMRSLPADIMLEIALAYESWPFRKSDDHLTRTFKLDT